MIPQVHLQPKTENQELYLRAMRSNDIVVASGSAGTGKAMPYDTAVLTPTGWQKLGSMKPGSAILGSDNKTYHVIGVYPQGTTDCYKITFADGRTLECSSDHLWEVNYYGWKEPRVLSLSQIMKFKEYRKLGIKPFVFGGSKQDLTIEPYLLGCLLGDGYFGKTSTMISSCDQQILSGLNQELYQTKGCRTIDWLFKDSINLRLKLKELGLTGTRSDTKFIPAQYLESTIEDRYALLQGLMDTDGTADKAGHLSFQVSNFKLASQVQQLVWSLGGVCKMTERKVVFTYKGEKKVGKPAWRLSIRLNEPEKAFRLERKKDRTANYQYRGLVKPRFKTIERVEDKPTLCISVSAPDKLFVVDNYILTHNTYLAVNFAVNLLAAKSKVNRLVLGRAAIPTGRSLGFFPGSIEEKLTPWLSPMLSVLKERLGSNVYDNQVRRGNILLQPLETIRGCSFENTAVLIDEAQNLTWEELKSITTRLGEGSKLFLMGDSSQRDLKESALEDFIYLVRKHNLPVGVVRFTSDDIVRSDLVGQLVRAYELEGV